MEVGAAGIIIGFAAAPPGANDWGGIASPWDVAWRVVAMLAVLLALAFLARRWGAPFARRSFGHSPFMRVVEGLPLGPQRGLYVVLVGERALVLGVTPQSVRLLLELTPEEARRLAAGEGGGSGGRFRHVLRSHWFAQGEGRTGAGSGDKEEGLPG